MQLLKMYWWNICVYKVITIDKSETNVLYTFNIEICNQIVTAEFIIYLKKIVKLFIILELFFLTTKKSEIKSVRRLIIIHKLKSCWLSCNNIKYRLVNFFVMTMIFLLCNVKLLISLQWQQFFNMRINNSIRLIYRQKKSIILFYDINIYLKINLQLESWW